MDFFAATAQVRFWQHLADVRHVRSDVAFRGQADIRVYEYMASAKMVRPGSPVGSVATGEAPRPDHRSAVLVRAGMALLSAVAPPLLSTTTLVPILARL